MSREDPQLKLRLPLDLKEKITESAKVNGRSMNAEIVYQLEEAYDENMITLPREKFHTFLQDVEIIINNSKDQAKLIRDQTAIIENLDEVIRLVDQTKFYKTKLAEIIMKIASDNSECSSNEDKNTPSTPPPKDEDWR